VAKGRGKGGQFERDLCREISRWWSYGLRDDIFWRDSSRRRGKSVGQHGDLHATDPIGKPLLDFTTIEAKKGYNRFAVGDLLDRDADGLHEWEKFRQQAERDQKRAGASHWILIWKRDRKKALIFFTPKLYLILCERGSSLAFAKPSAHFAFRSGRAYCTTFEEFKKRVQPHHITPMVFRIRRKK